MDVRRVLTDTAALLQNNAELVDGHSIVVDAPADPLVYRADDAQVRQIVWNLATNGLRAMPNGGELRLSVRRDGGRGDDQGRVVIAVRDHGVGIAPEEMDGIFQPFRGGFARGTGLGLSIVHRIASDYRGEVHVMSNQGSGTTVEVILPVGAPAAPVATPSKSVSTPRISGTASSAATKCISDVPGLVKHTSTPESTSVRSSAWAPFTRRSLLG